MKGSIGSLSGSVAGASDNSMRVVEKADRPEEEEFEITISKTASRRDLGLAFKTVGGCLRVKAIYPGLVADWNQIHPGLEVMASDRIVAVDGIRGSPQTLEELIKEATILMQVVIVLVRSESRRAEQAVANSYVDGQKYFVNWSGWLGDMLKRDQLAEEQFKEFEEAFSLFDRSAVGPHHQAVQNHPSEPQLNIHSGHVDVATNLKDPVVVDKKLTCPSGHALHVGRHPTSLACAVCEQDVRPHDAFYECLTCSYACCPRCVTNDEIRAFRKAVAPPPFAVVPPNERPHPGMLELTNKALEDPEVFRQRVMKSMRVVGTPSTANSVDNHRPRSNARRIFGKCDTTDDRMKTPNTMAPSLRRAKGNLLTSSAPTLLPPIGRVRG